jgi:hypothetical protein
MVFALGFALFIPQFWAPPAVRIAHGVLVAAGCVILALTLALTPALIPALRGIPARTRPATPSPSPSSSR